MRLVYSAFSAKANAFFAIMKTSTPSPLIVDLYWDADCLSGVAFTLVDVMTMINQVAAMRVSQAPPAVHWRWRRMDTQPIPRWLPSGPSPGKRQADVAVVPGWHAQTGPHLDRLIMRSSAVVRQLQTVHNMGGQLAMVYNGSALAARCGLLNGHHAAVPWPFMASVLRQSNLVQIVTGVPWLVANRVWTSDSPVGATELLLDLLRHTAHPTLATLAESVQHILLPPAVRRKVAALNAQVAYSKVLPEGAVELACRWLEANLDAPYSLHATAKAASTSPRTLLRHFVMAHGKTPLDYLHGLRMARAQVLLETSYVSVEQISKMCGYSDVGTFRRLFVRFVGKRPSEYRTNYQLRTSRKRWGEIQKK